MLATNEIVFDRDNKIAGEKRWFAPRFPQPNIIYGCVFSELALVKNKIIGTKIIGIEPRKNCQVLSIVTN